MKTQARQKRSSSAIKNIRKVTDKAIQAVFNRQTTMNAAAIGYYGALSFFPLMAALVAFAGLILTDAQITQVAAGVSDLLPKGIAGLLNAQLQNVTEHPHANIWVFWGATAIALFGVSSAVDSTISAVNSAYGLKETRHFIRQKTLSITLTVLFILGMVIVLPLVFIGPGILAGWGVPQMVITIFGIVRWLALIFLALVGLGVLYHYAPNTKKHTWRWISPGSVVAALLWFVITVIFFIYLQYFANFSNSYSLFAGILAMMMWINFSALAILVGANVNKPESR